MEQLKKISLNESGSDVSFCLPLIKVSREAISNWLEKAEQKTPFKKLIKPIDVARGLAFLCSEESSMMTGSIVDFDQTVHGWHSYSAYDTKVMDDSLLGE